MVTGERRGDGEQAEVLRCELCREEFERPNRRGPRPRFCSADCRKVALATRRFVATPEFKARLDEISEMPSMTNLFAAISAGAEQMAASLARLSSDVNRRFGGVLDSQRRIGEMLGAQFEPMAAMLAQFTESASRTMAQLEPGAVDMFAEVGAQAERFMQRNWAAIADSLPDFTQLVGTAAVDASLDVQRKLVPDWAATSLFAADGALAEMLRSQSAQLDAALAPLRALALEGELSEQGTGSLGDIHAVLIGVAFALPLLIAGGVIALGDGPVGKPLRALPGVAADFAWPDSLADLLALLVSWPWVKERLIRLGLWRPVDGRDSDRTGGDSDRTGGDSDRTGGD